VGIIAAAIISIINDRTHAYVPILKILTPIVAVAYLAFLFAPPTRTIIAPYLILAVLGAASFGLMPIALEYVVEVTFPVSPEVTSTIMWTAGQILGGVFIIIMGELKDNEGLEDHSRTYPPGNLQRALLFEAIICCLTALLPFGLGMKVLGLDGDRRRRFAVDEGDAGEPRPPTVNR
jgi:MFS transporter, FLVCR family, MFS-domain-containing protein 7